MKQLFEDALKVGASLQEWAFMPTPIGRLQTQVRLARPNWSSARCMRAAVWIKRNGLKGRDDYSGAEVYRDHILRLLRDYARANVRVSEHQVADDLSLARWEARWRRARTRMSAVAVETEQALGEQGVA